MPMIIDLHDPAGIRGRTTHETDAATVGAALLQQYPDGFDVQRDIYLDTINAEPLTIDDMDTPLGAESAVYVVTRQHGGSVGKAVSVISGGLFGFKVVEKALNWLYPMPEIPDFPDIVSGDQTAQNSLPTAQTNRARPFGAIPDLFGAGNATPDLIAPAVMSYSNNKRVIKELFCLGIGEYTISDTYDDVTNTDNITDYTVTTYGPGTYPSSLRTFRSAVDVEDIELRAPNDQNFVSEARGVFVKQNASVAIGTVTFSNSAGEITFSGYDNIRQLGAEVGDTLTVAGTTSNNGSYTILDISYSDPTVTIAGGGVLTDETSSATLSIGNTGNILYWFDNDVINNLELSASDTIYITTTGSNNGTYTISSYSTVSDPEFGTVKRFVLAETVVDEDDSTSTMSTISGTDAWTEYYQLPGTGNTVRVFLVAPQGLKSAEDNKISIGVTVEIQETDADGFVIGGGSSYSNDYTLTGNTRDRIAVHKDVTVTSGYYRVRAKRTTDTFDGGVDLVVLEMAAMLEPYSGADFGDVTVIEVERKENESRSGRSSGKFNVDYIRKLPDWTPGGGYSATLTNSYDIFRAALYQHYVRGGYPLDQMDLQGLYDINAALSADLRAFSASFDDVNMSHADRMKTILNAARVYPYRDGQIWRFWRDESRPTPVASFDIRNLTGNDTISYTSGLPSDYESVSVQYRDPDTNTIETVSRRINLSTGAIVDDEIGSNVKSINLVGCRNVTQARNRADYEIRLIRDSERTVTTEVLGDWKYCVPGDVVRWADIYDSDVSTGEVKAISGTEYTTNNLLPQDGGTYYGTITDANGDVSTPVVVTITGDKTFAATFDVTGFVADGATAQCGSRYTIGGLSDMSYALYWIASIQPSDTRSSAATLTLVNYDDATFEDD